MITKTTFYDKNETLFLVLETLWDQELGQGLVTDHLQTSAHKSGIVCRLHCELQRTRPVQSAAKNISVWLRLRRLVTCFHALCINQLYYYCYCITGCLSCLGEEKITEIDAEDLEKIEDVFEHIAESRRELGLEVEDLAALKEDITEYQEVLFVIWFSLKIIWYSTTAAAVVTLSLLFRSIMLVPSCLLRWHRWEWTILF